MPKTIVNQTMEKQQQQQLLFKQAMFHMMDELGFVQGSNAFRHYVNNAMAIVSIAAPKAPKHPPSVSPLLQKDVIKALEFAYNGNDLEMGTIARRFENEANRGKTADRHVYFDDVNVDVFSALKSAAAMAIGTFKHQPGQAK